MIGHRDGHTVTICDGCYRPRRMVQVVEMPEITWGDDVKPHDIVQPIVSQPQPEPGWEHSDEGGYPEAYGRSEGRVVVQVEQGLDYCPACAAERAGTLSGTR